VPDGTIVTQAVPETPPIVPQDSKPAESPIVKPQYDQIKIIEEKARASIRVGDGRQTISKDDSRSLRSKDGASRSKTELAQYFPSFEEMLNLEPPDLGMYIRLTYNVSVDRVRCIDGEDQGARY